MSEQILNNNDRNRRYSQLNITQIPCICCGTCCQKFQPRLTLQETLLISEKLGITQAQFLAEYTDPRWPGTQSFLVRHENGACLFLKSNPEKKQKLCSIHAFKPECCSSWNSDLKKAECQTGLKAVRGLSIEADGKICGEEAEIKKFEDYVNSLTQ